MTTRFRRAFWLGLAPLVACATSVEQRANRSSGDSLAQSPTACDVALDRAAILNMAGEYEVSFAFNETVPLAPGYVLRKPYATGGSELVIVAEASDRTIALQHILVVEDDEGKATPMKHWRQDWTFEDDSVLEYAGAGHWKARALAPGAIRCTWVQEVYGIEDGPRYGGVGRWVHAGGVSTWTSNETWRPLPRREATTRKDYDVLTGVNRHTITPDGWVHEQDNAKLVLRGTPRALVREKGVNRYQRTNRRDFSVARQYWQKSEALWRDVRAAWRAFFSAEPEVWERTDNNGPSLRADLVALEDEAGLKPGRDRARRAEEVIRRHMRGGAAAGGLAASER